jgi:hypothetical protein
VRPAFGGRFGPQSRASVGSGPQVRYSALGSPSRTRFFAFGVPVLARHPCRASSHDISDDREFSKHSNRRAGTLALQKPQGSPPYSDRTRADASFCPKLRASCLDFGLCRMRESLQHPCLLAVPPVFREIEHLPYCRFRLPSTGSGRYQTKEPGLRKGGSHENLSHAYCSCGRSGGSIHPFCRICHCA